MKFEQRHENKLFSHYPHVKWNLFDELKKIIG